VRQTKQDLIFAGKVGAYPSGATLNRSDPPLSLKVRQTRQDLILAGKAEAYPSEATLNWLDPPLSLKVRQTRQDLILAGKAEAYPSDVGRFLTDLTRLDQLSRGKRSSLFRDAVVDELKTLNNV
jgi:hypothetical protein